MFNLVFIIIIVIKDIDLDQKQMTTETVSNTLPKAERIFLSAVF